MAPETQKIKAPLLRNLSSDPEKIVDVIVVGRNPSSVKALLQVENLRAKRVIAILNAVAGQMLAKHVIQLSRSSTVRSIEIDEEVSITL